MMMLEVFAGLVGFSQGVFSGAALMALMVIIKLHSRLRSRLRIDTRLEWFSLIGAMAGSFISLTGVSVFANESLASFAGLFGGVYIGLLTASIAETAYVLPKLSQRFKLHSGAKAIAFAWLLGKIAGSFMNWLAPNWQ